MPANSVRIGQRFHWLKVVSKAPRRNRADRWVCRCKCGAVRTVMGQRLRSGTSKSCGCYSRGLVGPRATSHGHAKNRTKTPELRAWCQMNYRCHTPSSKGYPDYGGRGIRVCDAWRHSFEVFLGDVGPRPTSRHSLHRKDNDGPYDPSNVRWALPEEQLRNTRRTLLITFHGETRCVKDWAHYLRINYGTLRARLKTLGWPVEKAFTHRVHVA